MVRLASKKALSAIFGLGLLCVSAIPAFADPEAVMDKAWWDNQPATVRDQVVSGLIEGYNAGFIAGYYVTDNNKDDIKKFNDYRNFSHSLRFYEDAINDFYSTYPKAVKTTIGTILICNADKAVTTCDSFGKPDSK